MDQNLKTIFDFIQQNENLTADEKNTFSNAVKEVDKELAITTFKLDRTEKVKRTTAILLEETIKELEQKRKAVEAQNHELEIESALERVRSRSMAMHDSTDLSAVVYAMFTELVKLDAQLDRCLILIVNPQTLDITWYLTGKEGLLSNNGFLVPDNPHPSHQAYLEGWRNKRKKWHYLLEGEEKQQWDTYGFSQTGLAQLPDFIKADMVAVKAIHLTISSDEFGCLIASSLSPLSDVHAGIVDRFTSVFNQTYTRFLDLKKAEAQAREAQIEASLERLRSKTMAMHNSHDVGESVAILFDELERLEVKTKRCGVLIHGNPVNTEVWTAKLNLDGKAALIIGHLDMTVHPLLSGARNSWLNKESSFSYELKGDDIKNYFRVINETKNYPYHFNIETLPPKEFHSDFHFRDGSIFTFTTEPISSEAAIIFKRFAGVFGQTYRRYLDLQKAEAQAREAQIEAALERVRSQSMSMHKSEELHKVVTLVFEQFQHFGIKISSTVIYIFEDNSPNFNMWTADGKGSYVRKIHKLYINHPIVSKVFESWSKGKDFLSDTFNKEETHDYMSKLVQLPDFRNVPDERKKYLLSVPGYARSVAYGKYIGIAIANYDDPKPFSNVENDILRRVVKVFEQAYVRFLDLQKAENQAREAIKASSLDRVRAEIASMRTINDLQRITPIIWHELTALGVPFVRCGVFIMNETTEHVQVHLSSPDGRSLGLLDLPFNSGELTINSVNHWRQGIIFKTHWNKDEFLNFMKTMINQGQISNQETYQGAATPPESLHLHFIPFKQGMLYVGSSLPLEVEELQLVKSLAESFSIAYARYEDFRQLEEAKNQIEKTFTELKAAQAQLIQSEKMASLGELTAGIAHEIQNPLNFVNNFSEISNELIVEIEEERAKNPESRDENLVSEILSDIKQNLEKINNHGKRAADIVKGMLQHSRTSSGQKEPTDINALADEYLRLAFHGLKAKDKSFNAEFKTEFDPTLPKINVIPQDIGRVLLNLINNAFYAVQAPPPPKGGIKERGSDFKPTVIVRTSSWNPPSGGRGALISVIDNGPGIPAHIVDKIYQPFFTTKPTGQGTGLGLSLSYDIVKAHGGEIKVKTKENEGTEFIILLPVNI